jgi:hypothetical protein
MGIKGKIEIILYAIKKVTLKNYPLMLFFLPYLHVLDILSTWVALDFGLSEGNPIMKALIETSGFFMASAYSFLFVMFAVIILYHGIYYKKQYGLLYFVYFLYVVYLTVPISNSLMVIFHILR